MRLTFVAVLMALSTSVAAQTLSDSSKRGYADLQAGESKAAFSAFTASLKADPRDGAAAYGRALALFAGGKNAEAASMFAAYEKAGGRNPRLDLDYGSALVRSGKAKDGIARLERYGASGRPDAGEAKLMLGAAYVSEKRFGDAEGALKGASAIEAYRPSALLLLAGMEVKRDRKATAQEYLATLRKEAPNSAALKALDDVIRLKKESKK